MTLTGIFKSILLVIVSVLIWNTTISFLQFIGYGIALAGLAYYSLGWDQIVSVSTGFASWLKTIFDLSGVSEARLPPGIRRILIAVAAAITVAILVAGVLYGTGYGSIGAQTPASIS